MSDRITVVTSLGRERANNVLNWFKGGEGYPGGGFFDALLKAASKADEANLVRLAHSYPEIIAAYRLATREENGLDIIREVANS